MKNALPVVLALLGVACAEQKIEPVIASSAAHGSYAGVYPASLTAAAKGFNDRRTEASKVFGTFKDFPAKLKDPAWNRVLEIVKAADDGGKSRMYADRVQRIDGAHVFFETEKDELNKKVGGSAQYVVKKKSCDVEVYGAVSTAMKDGVDKQLEKELREISEAHMLIDRYKTPLKKENVPELEKQADSIEFASYLVHIEVVNDKLRINRMIVEGEQIKKTQQDFIEAESAYQKEKGVTDADKKESQERIATMKKAQGQLESALSQAKDLQPKVEEEIQNLTKQYDDALADLEQRIKAKTGK